MAPPRKKKQPLIFEDYEALVVRVWGKEALDT